MFWPFTAIAHLRRLGILGMNRRNAEFILDHNPRASFPLVDDKFKMHQLCRGIAIPTPRIYAVIESHSDLRRLQQTLGEHGDFVVKPNRGCAGRGVMVLTGKQGDHFLRHDGERLSLDRLRQHLSDILSGMYSLGGRPDLALFQQRVRLHPAFDPVCYKGVPDIRVIVYRNEPAMAMLRLPTRESSGRANLHQGGIGAGIDLPTGITHHAVQYNRLVDCHPDTDMPLRGVRVPCWDEILDMARRVAEASGLGFVGVDIIVDADQGPLLLEANARPGLAIQIANARGLLPALRAIDAQHDQAEPRLLIDQHRRAQRFTDETLRKSA